MAITMSPSSPYCSSSSPKTRESAAPFQVAAPAQKARFEAPALTGQSPVLTSGPIHRRLRQRLRNCRRRGSKAVDTDLAAEAKHYIRASLSDHDVLPAGSEQRSVTLDITRNGLRGPDDRHRCLPVCRAASHFQPWIAPVAETSERLSASGKVTIACIRSWAAPIAATAGHQFAAATAYCRPEDASSETSVAPPTSSSASSAPSDALATPDGFSATPDIASSPSAVGSVVSAVMPATSTSFSAAPSSTSGLPASTLSAVAPSSTSGLPVSNLSAMPPSITSGRPASTTSGTSASITSAEPTATSAAKPATFTSISAVAPTPATFTSAVTSVFSAPSLATSDSFVLPVTAVTAIEEFYGHRAPAAGGLPLCPKALPPVSDVEALLLVPSSADSRQPSRSFQTAPYSPTLSRQFVDASELLRRTSNEDAIWRRFRTFFPGGGGDVMTDFRSLPAVRADQRSSGRPPPLEGATARSCSSCVG